MTNLTVSTELTYDDGDHVTVAIVSRPKGIYLTDAGTLVTRLGDAALNDDYWPYAAIFDSIGSRPFVITGDGQIGTRLNAGFLYVAWVNRFATWLVELDRRASKATMPSELSDDARTQSAYKRGYEAGRKAAIATKASVAKKSLAHGRKSGAIMARDAINKVIDELDALVVEAQSE